MKILFFVLGIVAAFLMCSEKTKKVWIPSLIAYWACILITVYFG